MGKSQGVRRKGQGRAQNHRQTKGSECDQRTVELEWIIQKPAGKMEISDGGLQIKLKNQETD